MLCAYIDTQFKWSYNPWGDNGPSESHNLPNNVPVLSWEISSLVVGQGMLEA